SDISSMGYIKTDTNTQLSESQVDSYVANNGYASSSDSRLSNARTPVVSSQANGDIMYYQDGWRRLPKGNDNQVLSLSSGYPSWKNNVVDTNTWVQNSVSVAGYVPAGSGKGNSFYSTDSTGSPAWRPINSSSVGLSNVQNINMQNTYTMNANQTIKLSGLEARDNNGFFIKDNDNNIRFSISDSGVVSAGNGSGINNLNASYLTSGKVSNSLLYYATTSGSGIVQLTNSYSSNSQSLAPTQKALYDGLTYVQSTKQNVDSDLSDLADGSLTGSKVQAASTSVRGTVQLSNSYSSTSQTMAPTLAALRDGLSTKQAADSDLSDLADGSLTGSKVQAASTGVRGTVQLTNTFTSNSQSLATTQKALYDGLSYKQNADADLSDLADGSLTGSKVQAASTSVRGTVQLSSSLTSTSESTAATSKSVKSLKDSLNGLGSMSSQNSGAVNITGGDIVASNADVANLKVTNLTVVQDGEDVPTNQLFPVKVFGSTSSKSLLAGSFGVKSASITPSQGTKESNAGFGFCATKWTYRVDFNQTLSNYTLIFNWDQKEHYMYGLSTLTSTSKNSDHFIVVINDMASGTACYSTPYVTNAPAASFMVLSI
ncbi:MAG: hypothetical protein CMK38_06950, partial [Porticoccaceae bacterium]|nr:hypothetical protein [Porticoccaceae bacterium]